MLTTDKIAALIQLADRAPKSAAERLWLDGFRAEVEQELEAQQAAKAAAETGSSHLPKADAQPVG